MNSMGHQDFKLIPVFIQQFKAKGGWNRIDLPRFCLRLEAAHDQAANFFLVINVAIGVAHHRQHRMRTSNRAGDDIEMFGGIKRHVYAGKSAKLPRPLPATIDHHLALNVTLCGAHADGAAAFNDDVNHLGIFNNANAAVPRAFRQ